MSIEYCDEYDLPKPNKQLCFKIEEFSKEDFDVDEFVIECRRNVQLESLRNDLKLYLDDLEDAIIEIINKDYADFVSLSTKLVTLEKFVNSLSLPLNALREKLLVLLDSLNCKIKAFEEKINREQQIKLEKTHLKRLMNIVENVQFIEDLLNGQEEDLCDYKLERISSLFNHLQFNVNLCKESSLVENIKTRITSITCTLQNTLESLFKESLLTNNILLIRKCLQIYSHIDKHKEAEKIFSDLIVSQELNSIINEEYLTTNGLSSIYQYILNFIPNRCKYLREALIGNNDDKKPLIGFEFVVNSIWPEVISRIMENLSCIFNAGNPQMFFEKYTISIEFIENFEKNCSTQQAVMQLKRSYYYTAFMNKWSLPVYFQIRFQEIAGSFESVLFKNESKFTYENNYGLNTEVSCSILHAVKRCWAGDVFIPTLIHRFWKLTLQILSRYKTWLSSHILKEDESIMAVCVIDASILIETKIPEIYQIDILPRIMAASVSGQCRIQIESCLTCSYNEINDVCDSLCSRIKDILLVKSTDYLKNVNDLPRLYRKTNKEVPSKPSKYIETCCTEIETFFNNAKKLQNDRREKLMKDTVINIAQQFENLGNELLLSMKKMEESLRRLKRKGTKQSSGRDNIDSGVSDDDKIRMQIALDCNLFVDRTYLMIEGRNVDELENLLKLAKRAKSEINNSQ